MPWSEAEWLNPPPSVTYTEGAMVVEARQGSDFWSQTHYGFVRDSGHALLTRLTPGLAVEVSFLVDFDELYDQAGVMLRVDPQHWIKAGVEMTDGVPHLGAVATFGRSDWSLAPVPDWQGSLVTVRMSWTGSSVTIRARREAEPWRVIRLVPFPEVAAAAAGPYCCAPERGGLRTRFTGFSIGPADRDLHSQP
ncbi:DUF1349 domain-containing protein [Streptomyces heilongjiangensis]|nr:DUF1349 domain-containing protein [Streptomyces heilongjiangensis]MDC2947928.1 DUF1349 domain-containing protein [Streptomyces heilongjiangensis]